MIYRLLSPCIGDFPLPRLITQGALERWFSQPSLGHDLSLASMSGGAAYFPICGLKCPFAGDYSCHGSKCAHVFGCLIKYIYIYIHRYIGFYRYAYIETEVYRIHIIEYIL